MNRSVLLSLLGACSLGSCDDGSGPGATTGQIRVVLSTTGVNMDPDGYFIYLDDALVQNIGVNETLTLTALSPGEHYLVLADVALNCTRQAEPPASVIVTAGETIDAVFTIICSETAAPGQIQVYTSTSGIEPDADGYGVLVDGNEAGTIAANGSSLLTEIPVGEHTVALSGVAPNCEVTNDHPAIATVFPDFTGTVSFTIACYSPVGGRLVFASSLEGSTASDIYVINADGTGRARLTRSGAEFPDWSPDGSRIAFNLQSGGIVVMNADGTDHDTLTNQPGDGFAAWSPDGARLAYSLQSGQIGVIRPDGTGRIILTDEPGGSYRWSPDGTRIVYLDRGLRINVIYADGTRHVMMPEVPEPAWISWSPDSRRLLFEAGATGERDHIYIVNADGTGLERLTDLNQDDYNPAWSPDGSRIAFISSRVPANPYQSYHVFTMSPIGDDIRQITKGELQYFRAPVWSPEGTQLLVNYGRGLINGLTTINVADGSGGGINLFKQPFAAWSPDGSFLTWDVGGDIWIIRRDGSGEMNLTQTPGQNESSGDWQPIPAQASATFGAP